MYERLRTIRDVSVSRLGDSAGDLTVNLSIAGTAAAVKTTTVPRKRDSAGQTNVLITITSRDDGEVEGDETVVLTVASGANYVLGHPPMPRSRSG